MASALGSVNPRDEDISTTTTVAGVAVAHTPVLYVAPLLALGLTLGLGGKTPGVDSYFSETPTGFESMIFRAIFLGGRRWKRSHEKKF